MSSEKYLSNHWVRSWRWSKMDCFTMFWLNSFSLRKSFSSENMSIFPLSSRPAQCWSFFLKASILLFAVRMFIDTPCNDKFKPFNFSKMQDKYSSFTIQPRSKRLEGSLCFLFMRNKYTSSLSSYKRVRTLPLDNHLTSEWRRRLLWCEPISWHRVINSRVWRGLNLIKLTIFIAALRTL